MLLSKPSLRLLPAQRPACSAFPHRALRGTHARCARQITSEQGVSVGSYEGQPRFFITGRHLAVTSELEEHVKQRLTALLTTMLRGDVLESEVRGTQAMLVYH